MKMAVQLGADETLELIKQAARDVAPVGVRVSAKLVIHNGVEVSAEIEFEGDLI